MVSEICLATGMLSKHALAPNCSILYTVYCVYNERNVPLSLPSRMQASETTRSTINSSQCTQAHSPPRRPCAEETWGSWTRASGEVTQGLCRKAGVDRATRRSARSPYPRLFVLALGLDSVSACGHWAALSRWPTPPSTIHNGTVP
jgi:hypothetical protein